MVIARRVRGRFSVTRLLSRLVRFYFVLSHSSPPSFYTPLSSVLFPLDPSLLLAFGSTESSRVLWSLDTSFFSLSLSVLFLLFSFPLVSFPFLALLFFDLAFVSFRHSPRRFRTPGLSILLSFILSRVQLSPTIPALVRSLSLSSVGLFSLLLLPF